MKKDQIVYLEKIEKFCARYKNVELMSFVEPKGLSYLWNKILLRSRGDSVLLLNDDVNIKMKFQDLVIKSGILSYPITTINSSWSHFIISKVIFNKIGPFDEGLKEIGGEDDDYAARLAMMGRTIKDFSTKAIARKLRRKRRLLKCNSYGKDMNLERFGYSNLNSEYLAKKWETGMEYFDGAVMVPNRSIRYWKLRKKWSSN
ncbi:MAG: glycosyltransferase family 2 protein [Candidatus Aminicenantes bacterium]|nr:glycosyltransferase family 2 protein [Candidatus Aminicenantes bacterium]